MGEDVLLRIVVNWDLTSNKTLSKAEFSQGGRRNASYMQTSCTGKSPWSIERMLITFLDLRVSISRELRQLPSHNLGIISFIDNPGVGEGGKKAR